MPLPAVYVVSVFCNVQDIVLELVKPPVIEMLSPAINELIK